MSAVPDPDAFVDGLPSRVISLDDGVYEGARKRLEEAGFQNISMMKAVNGKEMKSSLLGARDSMTYRAECEIEYAPYREAHSSLPSWGGVGCYLSHVEMWKEAMNSQYGIFVFESDVKPAKGAFEKTKAALSDLVKSRNNHLPGMMYMGGFGFAECSDVPGTPVCQLKERLFGTEAYYISPEGAKYLVANAFPMEVQVDTFIGYNIMTSMSKDQGGAFSAYLMKSRPFQQENLGGTSIQTKPIRDGGGEDPRLVTLRYVLMAAIAVLTVLFLLEYKRVYWSKKVQA